MKLQVGFILFMEAKNHEKPALEPKPDRWDSRVLTEFSQILKKDGAVRGCCGGSVCCVLIKFKSQ